jgi:hypothetical protein
MTVRVFRSTLASVQSGDSYGLVLTLLVASVFVGVAVPDELWARILRDAVIATTAVVTYWTAIALRAFLVPRVVVPAIAIVFIVFGALEGVASQAVASALGVVLIAAVTLLVVRDLFDRGRVDVQTVLGALSLYVLVGIFFASAYSFVAATGDGAFFTRGDDGSTGEHLYFSLVTITTTGFGDLAPASDLGRALASVEVVFGQLYLTTVVAVILAAAARRRRAPRPDDPAR